MMRKDGTMGIIYIGCPAKAVTGGPTLLHQMCRALLDKGVSAKMYYFGKDSLFDTWDGIEDSPYAKYEVEAAKSFQEIDQEGNTVILPEIVVPIGKAFFKARVHIWWTSVNNYLYTLTGNEARLSEDLELLLRGGVIHFIQSRYAYDFLSGDMQISEDRIHYLTDYIDEKYLQECELTAENREDIVYYNFKKQGNDLPRIIEEHPEINWVPIKDMTQDEIIANFHKGKVYVDFGTHPGKDRLPRESASCGLCVLTNREGAALNEEDIPISDEYKFANPGTEKDSVIERIRSCFVDYDKRIDDFAKYRSVIREEKDRFLSEVDHFIDVITG